MCCLATSNSKDAIISDMFDKLPYFGHISSKGPVLDFGVYAILLLIEVFWFITTTFNMIRLFRLSTRGYFETHVIFNTEFLSNYGWCAM